MRHDGISYNINRQSFNKIRGPLAIPVQRPLFVCGGTLKQCGQKKDRHQRAAGGWKRLDGALIKRVRVDDRGDQAQSYTK